MVHPRLKVDDHPLLTARHADNLTDAVHALSRLVSKTNELLQKQLLLMAQRTPLPTRDPSVDHSAKLDLVDIAPLITPSPSPVLPSRPRTGPVTSNRATAPRRRRNPR